MSGGLTSDRLEHVSMWWLLFGCRSPHLTKYDRLQPTHESRYWDHGQRCLVYLGAATSYIPLALLGYMQPYRWLQVLAVGVNLPALLPPAYYAIKTVAGCVDAKPMGEDEDGLWQPSIAHSPLYIYPENEGEAAGCTAHNNLYAGTNIQNGLNMMLAFVGILASIIVAVRVHHGFSVNTEEWVHFALAMSVTYTALASTSLIMALYERSQVKDVSQLGGTCFGRVDQEESSGHKVTYGVAAMLGLGGRG